MKPPLRALADLENGFRSALDRFVSRADST
jgi:hypothetical protein